nr:PREDICTED: uncharacterized protein LOC105679552 isoform X2 [Linepithema humile]
MDDTLVKKMPTDRENRQSGSVNNNNDSNDVSRNLDTMELYVTRMESLFNEFNRLKRKITNVMSMILKHRSVNPLEAKRAKIDNDGDSSSSTTSASDDDEDSNVVVAPPETTTTTSIFTQRIAQRQQENQTMIAIPQHQQQQTTSSSCSSLLFNMDYEMMNVAAATTVTANEQQVDATLLEK